MGTGPMEETQLLPESEFEVENEEEKLPNLPLSALPVSHQ